MPQKSKTISLSEDNWKFLDELKDSYKSYNGAMGAVRLLLDTEDAGARHEFIPTGGEGVPPSQKNPSPTATGRKVSKSEKVKQELAASDLTAQSVGRDDIEYGHNTELPRGEHVGNLTGITSGAAATGKLAAWRKGRSPLLKPKEKR